MIHEMVHAYINALYSNVVHFNSFTFRQKIEKYAKENGYTIDTNKFHHEFMSQYVNAIAYSLYEWDKVYGTGKGINNITKPDDLLGWDYYYAMAWGGLFETDSSGTIVSTTSSFVELVPSSTRRQQYADIVFNELKANTNSNGTKCN